MRRRSYLFRQLLGLACAASLPLLVLLAYDIHDTAETAREHAFEAVDNHASAVARDVEELLQATRHYLAFVARQPLVRALDAQRCDPILVGITQRRAHFADVLVVDATGHPVCSSVGGPGGGNDGAASLPWVAQALQSDGVVLGAPYVAPGLRRHVLAMAQALHGDGGQPTGVVAVLFDLDSLQRSWQRYRLPAGSRLSVLSEDGTVIVTAPDGDRWIGHNVSAVVEDALRANPGGKGSALGMDGVERTFSRQPVDGWGWSAYAAVPTATVFASYRAHLRRSAVVAALAVGIAALLTALLARRLVAPLRGLVATADAVRDGDDTRARADSGAPGEFGEVATAFNAMLERLGRSQAALRASQRRYVELFTNIDMLSVMTDRVGRITHANDGLLRAAGWRRDELVGQHVTALLPPGDGAEALRRALAEGRVTTVSEGPIVTRDGRSLTVRWHHSLLRDESDRIVGFASLGEDVTEAREAALRERRQLDFYAALSRTNGALLRIGDAQGLWSEICRICVEHGHASIAYISVVLEGGAFARPVAWAGPAQQFLGGGDVPLDPSRPQGRGITATAIRTAERFVVDDAENHPATLPWREQGRAIGTRSVAAFPFRRGQRVAGALTLHMTLPGFFDERVLALLDEMTADLSFGLDHLDRVEQLRQAQQTLREREQQLAGLVETAMDAIITIGTDRRIRLFNQAAAKMFGAPAEAVIGSTLDRFIPERLRPLHADGVDAYAAMAGSQVHHMGVVRSLTGLRSNGDEFPIEASISKWGEGQAALMTVVIRDVTQLREAEEARLAQAAAESASRAKNDFLSRMSHELRTPLNAVLGFSQLLQSDPADALSAQQAERVEHIRQAGWHLSALIDDVLHVSQIEAGRLRVEARAVDLAAALDEVLRLSAPAADRHGVAVSTPCRAGATPGVWADPVRLRQVLLNLVSNGIKYNRPGGTVVVDAERRGDEVRISVTDTGIGMTPEQLEHLYEPFNRLGRERAAEGTGLGLALARQLVLLMKGRIESSSDVDVGTRIDVWLPAGAPPAATATAARVAATPAPGSDAVADLEGRVLYIEDNPVNMLLVAELLRRWPRVRLIEAPNAATGIELVLREKPDLVLLDMRLPDMDGIGVLAELRRRDETRHLRIIALSASAMPQDVEAALAAGADDYWTKPLDFGRFIERMQRLLGPAGR